MDPYSQDFDDISVESKEGYQVQARFKNWCLIILTSISILFFGDMALWRVTAYYSIKDSGFHFPDQEPANYISEEKPPYYICIYRENSHWRWVIYKHEKRGVAVGGGSTESYLLSKNVALRCVIEDRER